MATNPPRPLEGRTWLEPGGGVAWGVPAGFSVRWAGEGEWKITLDPVFSGLAWAIIFGIFSSTLFTLVVIPVVYWLLHSRSPVAVD